MNMRAQKKAETSAKLLEVARQSFFKRGYAATSMDELCAEAGVTRGALYHNFGGKEGLFEGVVTQINDEIGERLLEIAGQEVSIERFVATCVGYLEMATDAEIQQIMFRDGPSVLGQRLREIDQDGSLGPLRDAIAELQLAGELISADPEALAVLLNGAMIDAALWIAESEKDKRLEAAKEALGSLVHSLRVCAK